MFLILSFIISTALLYFIFIKPFNHWPKRGVKQASIFKLWSYCAKMIFQLNAQTDLIQKMYKEFDKERFFGSYQLFQPVLMLRDPELIKQITVKDFDNFPNHFQFLSEETEPLWGRSLFTLQDDRWRDMRATLSPSFTSSKMRYMFNFINECAEQFVQHFEKKDSKTITVEFKDTFARFGTDVIASTAFGFTNDSLKDPVNEFYIMGSKATNLNGFWNNINMFVLITAPKFGKFLGLHMFNPGVSDFFRRLVKANMESREKHGIIRPDMIHLLMEAKKGRLKHDELQNEITDGGFAVIEESSVGKAEKRKKIILTDDDIIAQALAFFFAGFDSISTMLCFSVYELATNPDTQSKLYHEVVETLSSCGGILTYEALLKMKYLDMVVSETLRKWPSIILVDRVCVKPYTIEPVKEGEKPTELKVGDHVWLPIYAIHRDPKFYENPDCFDPERFSEENKSKIAPYSYIPFGAGPRSCIANRFALLEAKTILFHILCHYEVVVVEKSTVPIKISKKQFHIISEDGYWFGLKPRKKTD